MDQQSSLVSNGYALTYDSPESANIPDWAKWKSQAFATTYEPVVIAYNKSLLQAAEVPQTHADLVRLLSADPNRFNGKVATYDIEKSGVGFFLATQDVAAWPAFWDLARALRITVGATSKLVDRVEAAGLIRRELDADDRRASRVVLTDAGKQSLTEASTTYTAELASVLDATLTADELAAAVTRTREG